jgi:hypothetical protein
MIFGASIQAPDLVHHMFPTSARKSALPRDSRYLPISVWNKLTTSESSKAHTELLKLEDYKNDLHIDFFASTVLVGRFGSTRWWWLHSWLARSGTYRIRI